MSRVYWVFFCYTKYVNVVNVPPPTEAGNSRLCRRGYVHYILKEVLSVTTHTPKLIQSVQRAIDILDCFTAVVPSRTINEISEMTNLNINTARGLVNTLVANKLLLYDEARACYRLGNYFIGKADIIPKQTKEYILMFKSLADKISNTYHITSSLQLVSQDDIFSVYCAYPSSTAYYITLSEYSNLPIYATSSGKLLLTHTLLAENPHYLDTLTLTPYTPNTITDISLLQNHLKEIKEKQYAWEMEEFNLDVGSIAVPVFNLTGQLTATISATTFVKQIPSIKESLLVDLKNAAQTISNTLGNIEK